MFSLSSKKGAVNLHLLKLELLSESRGKSSYIVTKSCKYLNKPGSGVTKCN